LAISVKVDLRPRQRGKINQMTMETLFMFLSFSPEVLRRTSPNASAMKLKNLFVWDTFPGIRRPKRLPSSHIWAGLTWMYI